LFTNHNCFTRPRSSLSVPSLIVPRFAVLLFLVGLLPAISLLAGDYPPLTHLGIEQGLSNNSVRCIYQDHYGFMWFGTYDGLSRYDGYEFTVFRNKLNDSTSLPHNYIYAINEDRDNNVWVGTGQGVGIYNNLTAKFLPAYFRPYGTTRTVRISFNITAIKTDSLGNLFIGSNGWGLHVKRAGTKVALQVPYRNGTGISTGYNVQAVTIDEKQRVWLFIHEVGLCLYDKEAGQIVPVSNAVKAANCLEADQAGNLWLGTSKGLFRYSIAAASFVQSYTEEAGSASTGNGANPLSGALSSGNVACLSFDAQHRLWIGTQGGGVNILNTTTGKIDYLLPGEGRNTLTSESVFAIYEDKESRKWIGTLKGGIDIMDAQKNRFQTIAHNPLVPNSLINNFVSAFFEDKEGDLWIGTDGGGMSIWNRRTNHFTNFQHKPGQPSSLSTNSITCIRQDHLNNTWISTFGNGINRFNKTSGSFEHYRCINNLTGEENKNVWLLYEDRQNNLWATTFGDGRLYRYNRHLNRFDVFNQLLTDLIAITEDQNGVLWAGNSHELIKIDKDDKDHVRYEIGKPVRAIYEDNKGNFWIGTEGGGLILFDRSTGKVLARYSDANGLCNNSVLNILEDGEGSLWLSTFNGLSRFSPDKRSFKNFYQGDGLQSNQFLYSAALKLRSGELAFGGINGLNLFFPDLIRPRSYMPPLLLTGLRIDNKPVSMDDPYITRAGADQIHTIKIPFNKAILSFDFAALEYSAPSNIMYAYYLVGWDKDWNYTRNVRTVNYTNLSEGGYRLRMKSTNAEGTWNPKETTIDIVVLPPWYRSWWAWLLYASLLGAMIYYYRRYKARQTKLEYEIKIAHINAEKEKEINEKRLSFFTSISHEFRTPLTLIINPLKDILKKNTVGNEEDHKEVNIVYRNARRLLSLVDQLLLFRKAESEGDRLKITKLNFYELCREVYLAFVQKAREEEIEYRFECDNEGLELYADREKMEIVFYNLISNALKYTPAGGKVVFRLSETPENVEVTVLDTGHGIPKETGRKLFEKFYQVMENGLPSKTGFGIGLYLVGQFVESHKGTVRYESEPGQGTSFFISLRKGITHFEGRRVFEELVTSPVILDELAGNETLPIKNKPSRADKLPTETWVSEHQSILVIDDNEQILEYIHQIFANLYTVYRADSGEEGLRLARLHQPDVIITDIVMTNMTGIDLCRTIKEDLSLGHIPVILLTGSPSPETKLQGVEGGADDYITKPFEKEILLARVASLLKSRTNLQKYFYNEITLQKNTGKISEEDKVFIERCIRIVENHLDDDDFTIKTLAAEIGMSHSSLYKKIKSVSGSSVNGFIRFIRLRRVAELLINTEKNVNEAAMEAGFNDIKYFREQFHKLFGVMPSEYIKKFRPTFSKSLNVNRDLTKK
jgi:signal transduction histidine kinase/ligand-binding sensor domain-containing protein/AraC-like DNA-binding protein